MGQQEAAPCTYDLNATFPKDQLEPVTSPESWEDALHWSRDLHQKQGPHTKKFVKPGDQPKERPRKHSRQVRGRTLQHQDPTTTASGPPQEKESFRVHKEASCSTSPEYNDVPDAYHG